VQPRGRTHRTVRRRARRTIRRAGRRARAQLPFLIVLAVIAGGALYLGVSPGHWRRGSGLIAAAMLLAGLFRLVLRQPHAGMLRVRAAWIDVLCYWALGVAILLLAIRLD
jgi:hypothetical protein